MRERYRKTDSEADRHSDRKKIENIIGRRYKERRARGGGNK